MREITLAGDLIYFMLSFLNEKDIVDVDLTLVNFSSSAFRALEREYLDGPEEQDKTSDGLMKKAIRFVLSAVYFDGSPVIGKDTEIIGPMLVGYIEDGS